MSVTRMVLRFGKPFPLIKTILDRFKEHEKRPVRNIFWKTVSNITSFVYFWSDHPIYFHKIGLIKLDPITLDRIDYLNNIFWLMECVIDIFCDIVDLYYIQKEIQLIVIILGLIL